MKNFFAPLLICSGMIFIAAASCDAQTTDTWKGGTGNWSNAANWTGGVPNATTVGVAVDGGNAVNSVVDVDGGYTVGQLTIDAGDSVSVDNDQSLTINAGAASAATTIFNAGTLTLASSGNYTDLSIQSIVTLMGGGVVNVTSASRILGGGTLINADNTIQGDTSQTTLGYDQLAIVNQAAGVIDANHSGQALTLDPNAGGVINAGTLEASDGGLLVLSGYDVGPFANTGVIQALDGSQVQLEDGVAISGGVLSTTGSGYIDSTSGSTLADLTLQGLLKVANNQQIALNGTIVNDGVINLASSGNYTDIVVSGTTTLGGTGTINVTSASRFIGGGTLNIGAGQVIQGDTSAATLGYDQLTINNAGVIDANTSGAALVIDPNGGGLTNTGTLMASNGGTLSLSGYDVGIFVNNSTITALDASQVVLSGGVTVTGGLLSSSGTGFIHSTTGSTLNNVTLQGALTVDNDQQIALNGSFVNNGSITLASTGNYTDIVVGGTTTLSGGGVVNVTSASRIIGGGTLINVDNTIQGDTSEATLGYDQLTIVNQPAGVINANHPGQALTLDPNAGGVVNAGTLEASNGGTLSLSGYDVGTFTNTGVIEALDGSQVQLEDGAAISGGVLNTTGSGYIHSTNGSTLANLTLQGALTVDNNQQIALNGTIVNNGVINVASTGNYTDIVVSATTTLGGTGTINVTSLSRIIGGGTLNVGAGQVIQGDTTGATLGYDQLTINNAGVIDANANGAALVLDPNAGGVTNTGTLMASNGGTLSLSAYDVGTTTNNGIIDVEPGSTVSIDQNGLSNFANGKLTGGTYQVNGGADGVAATLVLDGTNIPASVTNAATVTLSGPNSNLPAFQNLVDNQGSLSLLALRQFATAGPLSNEGTIYLDAGCTLHVVGAFTAGGSPASSGSSPGPRGPKAAAAAGATNSTLHIVVGGTASSGSQSSGILQVDGLATLAGVLELELAQGAGLPNNSDTLTVLSAGSIAGTFANVVDGTRLSTTNNQGSFVVSQTSAGAGTAAHLSLTGYVAPGQTVPDTVTAAIAGDGLAVEGIGAGKVVVTRAGDMSTALTVRYKVGGTALSGTDYKPVTGTVTIPAGSAQAKVKIKPIATATGNGTFVAKLKLLPSLDGTYTLGTTTVAKIKIIEGE